MRNQVRMDCSKNHHHRHLASPAKDSRHPRGRIQLSNRGLENIIMTIRFFASMDRREPARGSHSRPFGWPDGNAAGAVTIGNFDGVHRGHARIVERLLAVARRQWSRGGVHIRSASGAAAAAGASAAAADVDRAQGGAARRTGRRSWSLIRPTKRYCSFRPKSSSTSSAIGWRPAMVEGPNFYFGRGRSGDIERLKGLCGQARIALEIVDPIQIDGELCIQLARAEAHRSRPSRRRPRLADAALSPPRYGYPRCKPRASHRLSHREHGRHRYALARGRCVCGHGAVVTGESCPAAINIGPNPTFGEHAHKVEVHLIDWHGDVVRRGVGG